MPLEALQVARGRLCLILPAPRTIEGPRKRTAPFLVELGYALPDEDFQVIRSREGEACHHVNDITVSLRKTGVSTVATHRADHDVWLYGEGARVGLPSQQRRCDIPSVLSPA